LELLDEFGVGIFLDIAPVASPVAIDRTGSIDSQIVNAPLVIDQVQMVEDLYLIAFFKGYEGCDCGLGAVDFFLLIGDIVLAVVVPETVEILLFDNGAEELGEFGAFVGAA